MQTKQTLWQQFQSPQLSTNYIITNSIRNRFLHAISAPKTAAPYTILSNSYHKPQTISFLLNTEIPPLHISFPLHNFTAATTLPLHNHLSSLPLPWTESKGERVTLWAASESKGGGNASCHFFLSVRTVSWGKIPGTIAPFPLLAVAISNSNQPNSTSPQHHSSRNSGTRTNRPALEAESKERKFWNFRVWA